MSFEAQAAAESIVQCVGAITNDIQSAALDWSLRSEGRDDHVSAGRHAVGHLSRRGEAVVRIREEVKNCPVVPKIKRMSTKCQRPHIATPSMNLLSVASQAMFGNISRGR